MHLAVILMLVILDFVILTLKAEGSSKVLVMKNNWMLRLRLSMTGIKIA